MSVTVDHETLAARELGLATVGQVLTHLQRDNRLVVNLLVDGARPDLQQMGQLRASPLAGHTLFIETVEPQAIARDVLDEVDLQLVDAERMKGEVVEYLQRNSPPAAMERLSGCFTIWNAARESLEKTTQLLRIDIEAVRLPSGTLASLMADFADQLRKIKLALEDRDFVSLADILAYEMTRTTERWQEAISFVRRAAGARRVTE